MFKGEEHGLDEVCLSCSVGMRNDNYNDPLKTIKSTRVCGADFWV